MFNAVTVRYDVITAWQLLEHVNNLDMVIGRVSRLLKPGGVFLGSVPEDKTGDCEVHLNYFNEEELKQWLLRYFAQVEIREYIMLETNAAYFTYRCGGSRTQVMGRSRENVEA